MNNVIAESVIESINENTADREANAFVQLAEVQLALVGGGSGNVIFG